MSGDEKNDVSIPVVFMFSAEAKVLTDYMDAHEDLQVYLARTAVQDRGESSYVSGLWRANGSF